MTRFAMLEADELRGLVADAVAEALEALPLGSAPRALMTRAEAAAYLSVSMKTLDTLRTSRGLPVRWVGDSPRFDRTELDAWTRGETATGHSSQSQGETTGNPAESSPRASGKGTAQKARGEKRNDSVTGLRASKGAA